MDRQIYRSSHGSFGFGASQMTEVVGLYSLKRGEGSIHESGCTEPQICVTLGMVPYLDVPPS